MIFPEYIKPGDTIGVTAPSGGVGKEVDFIRFNSAKSKLEKKGYKVIFTDNVFKDEGNGRSSGKEERARQFMELIKNPEVKYICSAKGGDFLMEILPYLDFDVIRSNPKWIQGYSDNTTLTFNICTSCDIATVYCNNFGDYGMEEWHSSIEENLSILEGNKNSQHSFDLYENGFFDKVTGLEGYSLTEPVNMKLYNGNISENKAEFSGRLIGGCLDVIMDVLGTRYENVAGFVDKYKNEGIIWYLESFYNNSEGVMRNMWKLNELGWFKNTKGIIFGREMMYQKFSENEFDEACMSMLEQLKIPVIFGADIGHKSPQLCMINGAYYTIKYCDGKLDLSFEK
ncbi:MAG: LD-carboxypeptidase [Lachnospiraceae bacterium]|nr:LD-carboxypeptidase [Lachnospiraceae bacterium]